MNRFFSFLSLLPSTLSVVVIRSIFSPPFIYPLYLPLFFIVPLHFPLIYSFPAFLTSLFPFFSHCFFLPPSLPLLYFFLSISSHIFLSPLSFYFLYRLSLFLPSLNFLVLSFSLPPSFLSLSFSPFPFSFFLSFLPFSS